MGDNYIYFVCRAKRKSHKKTEKDDPHWKVRTHAISPFFAFLLLE